MRHVQKSCNLVNIILTLFHFLIMGLNWDLCRTKNCQYLIDAGPILHFTLDYNYGDTCVKFVTNGNGLNERKLQESASSHLFRT